MEDGRIDVKKMAEGAEPVPASPHEFLTAPDGTKIPLIVGKNCYKVIGVFVPGVDGTRLIVLCEGRKMSPKEFILSIRSMGQSVMEQIQQSASRITVATDIPKAPQNGGQRAL